MSFNRCRNVFTLSDFQFSPKPPNYSRAKLKRRQNVDVFENDPFKIQSYNFHYAERPKFPIPTLPQINNRSVANDCRTFFYNEDFPHSSKFPTSNTQNDNNRSMNLTNFQEYRRRKYLQDSAIARNLTSCSNSNNNKVNKPFSSKFLNLSNAQQYKANCDQTYGKFNNVNEVYNSNIHRDTSQFSTTNAIRRDSKERTSALTPIVSSSNDVNMNLQQRSRHSQFTTSRGISINRGRSSSSGCEINININSGEDNSRTDNVIIKIETESKNNKPKLERLASSPSFFINKRLSKFSLNKEREERSKPLNMQLGRDSSKSKLDKVKLLTAVYSPQLLSTKPKKPLIRVAQSKERMPSMFPFRSNSDLGSYHDYKTKEILPARKISDNKRSSLTNIRDHSKPIIHPNYNSPGCSYNISGKETKLLNSPFLPDRKTFLKMFDSSIHRHTSKVSSLHSLPVTETRNELKSINPKFNRSHSKLPINVNINILTNKYKLLKT